MPFLERLKLRNIKDSFTTSNAFILLIRFVQLFFGGVILGIMAYYINLQRLAHQRVLRAYTFALTSAVMALATQLLYCIDYEHTLFFVWDLAVGLGYLIAMFWLLDTTEPYLWCKWSSFNPFGADRCAQTRSVLVMQIIETCLWCATAAFGFYKVYQTKRELLQKL